MIKTAKKRRRDYDDWDAFPVQQEPPAMTLPERRLWCEVLREACHAAMRGDERARYWIVEEPDSTFVTLCEFLGLNVQALRSAVTMVNPASSLRPRHRNQYSRMERAPEPASALPHPAPASVGERPMPINPAPAKANAPEPVCGPVYADPVPDVASGWTCILEPLEWGVPLPKRTRRKRVQNGLD
jgi:hypothetical protein